jgi:hypothetical protein
MEHGPPNFQDEVEKRESVRVAPVSVATTETLCKPGGDTPDQEKQTEEMTAPTSVTRNERLMANKTVSLILIISLTILVAVSVGSLIGIVAFRKSANFTAPARPLRQAVMTTVPSYQPMTSVVTMEKQQNRTEKVDEKTIVTEKLQKKKVVKARKLKAKKPISKISRESLENTMNAAKQGDPEAQYRLGTMYSKGVGVRKDTAEAMKWYRRAASRGHAKARENLEYVHE